MNSNSGTLLQAIRGPIMLITLGALMGIDQLGPYSFWRTWPALVIMFGLLKLLERVGGRLDATSRSGGGTLS